MVGGHARLACALAAPWCTRNKLGHGRGGQLGFRGERNEGERRRGGRRARSLCSAAAPRASARCLSGRDLPRCSSARLIELELTVRWLSAKPEYHRVLAAVPGDELQTPMGNFIYFSV